MRKAVSLLVASSLILSPFSVFAQDLEATAPTVDSAVETTTLSAAPNTSAATTTSAAISAGEYKEVACSSDAIFGQNTCDQCFTGRSVKVGERLTGLSDNWTNSTSNVLIAVKDEQKTPNMVAFDSVWTPTSADESKMWKSSAEIIWTPNPSTNKDEFQLISGQKVKLMETDLGAGFTLTSSTKKGGETIGLLRFPVTYYTMDMSTVTRSTTPTTHYECVKYTLDAPASTSTSITPGTPATPADPKKPTPVTPKTEVETGPTETLVLIIAAFFIAFGLMLSLRKRN